jgi:fructan beta-fructosidase
MTISCTNSSRNASKKSSVHFSSQCLGTPVALHFFENEYHLFYKYAQNDSIDGVGQLKSTDLLAWEEPEEVIKFQTDENFKAASVVRDWNNSSGLGTESEVLLTYFIKDKLLSASYSTDFGKTWRLWSENISLDVSLIGVNDFKVVWNDDVQKWVLVLLKDYEVEFYVSEDLMNWEFQSVFDNEPVVKKGDWTAVEFFPIEYSETKEMKWCLAVSTTEGAANYGLGTQYFVGDFNHLQFHTEDDVKWIDNGTDFNSPVVLTDYFLLDKAPVYFGKIDESQSITMPRSIKLIRKFNEFFICSTPINEINRLESKSRLIAGQEYQGELYIKQEQKLPLEVNLNFDLNNRKYLDFAEAFGLILENENEEKLIIGYHNLRRYFFISYKGEIVYAPCIIEQREVDMRLIIDRSSVELFAMDGFISMTKKYNSEEILKQLKLFAEGGKITLKEASFSELSSVKI